MLNHRLAAFSLTVPILVAASVACAQESTTPVHAQAAKVDWVASDLPPFAWLAPDGPHGLALDLVREMSRRLGDDGHVAFYPWARAVRTVQQAPNTAIVAIARTPDREQSFRWLVPLASMPVAFVGRPGTDLDHIETLRDERIGVLRGSFTNKLLASQGFTHIVQGTDFRELIRMLDDGIIDAAFAGKYLLTYAAHERGLRLDQLQIGMSLGTEELYIAASLSIKEAQAQRWIEAYKVLKADGTVARLKRKYQLEESRPRH